MAAGFGGNPAMRPDQELNLARSRAGSGPAPQSLFIVARRVIIFGPNGGLFVYSGHPAFGNLIDSITASGGPDQFGNLVLAGNVSYGAGGPGFEAVQVLNGVTTWYTAATMAGPWTATGVLGLTGGAGANLRLNALGGQLVLQGGSPLSAAGTEADSSFAVAATASVGREWYIPSNDATGVSDRTAINAALSAGYAVDLIPRGIYQTDQPIVIPDHGVLSSPGRDMAEPAGNYGAGGLAVGGARIKPVSGFTGNYVIKWGSAGAVQHGGQVVKGITVSCDLLAPATAIGGIQSFGFVAGVTLRDVLLFGAGNATGIGLEANNDGTPGHNPDFWDVSHFKSSGWGGAGIHTVGHADTYWTAVESTGNGGHNWHIENCANSRWLGCKGENSSGGDDWHFQDDAGFTGVLTFSACTSEQSSSVNGRQFVGTGTGTYIFRGCVFPNGTVYPANSTTIVNDDLPPVFDLVTGDFTGVAETIIGTYSIPANYLNYPNAQMRFHLWGRSILANIGDSIQLRLRANGVAGNILADFGLITGTNGIQRFGIEGRIGVDGAGAGGQVDTYAILNSTISGGAGVLTAASTGSVNVPLNAAATFVLTAQMSNAGDEAKTLGGTLILDAAL